MELTPSQKKTVRHQFDSFCRKVLREEARDYIRELMRWAAHEVPLSELSEEQMERLCVLDEYPSEAIHFDVQGYESSTINSYSGKRTYTVKEISDILGIGRTAAYKLVHSGVFKTVQIGTTIRVSKQSFDEWLDRQM